MQPTIRDVARKAETSVSTVSRVLTGQGPVADETRRRVMEAITALGYQPNALARGLVQKRSGTIGVVLPDVANPFCAEVLRGMGDVAAAHRFHLLLVNGDLSVAKEADGIAVLREKQVDGIIYTSGMITPDHREIFQRFRRPVVLAATYDPEGAYSGVLVDSRRGAQLAMEHVLDLGHRRIAVINGTIADSVAGGPRWQGYQEAAQARGVQLAPHLVAEGDYRLESGYWAMDRMLNDKDRPTAVVAGSDLMAIGAINAIQDRGLRVPEEISVVGFDNIWLAGAVRPGLTTVAQPMYDMGARAVAMLAQAIADNGRPATQWIQPQLVIRGST
ncbi:MAG TPA: LacI family DNA-binding transcriptional regulator, partial [Symbiobacteriaceae bacterium]|nr:LacI family DNA-binding transcriptional regulator [Symbiobacteriaceae bacterium]